MGAGSMPDEKPVSGPKPKKRATRSGAPALDPQAFLRATEGMRSDRKLKVGDVVFGQGDPSDAIFYIRTGRIQLAVVSDQGKEGVIALFGPGDFFGEGCLAGQPVRMASASATVPSDIIRIEKSTMVKLLQDNPKLSEGFMGFLLQRNIQVEADLVDQLFNSSEKRLARLLLLLANFSNDGELRPIAPKISQEVLAARVGTTRSRVNYFMNKFRKLGLIEYNGTIKVHTALINIIVHD
jgi:CRP/FNR family cyclic AMP-dependent transcriptional regulator